ncbi:MAG TPA: DUF3386 family protein [Nitrospinaceae bacterium]|jgi:hypothetical protein|nr:DUF3386 family protein [Nitrospinaceae bacterium]HIK57997.1 DUF3386 family protein [Nitrospinaceae bacterium]
MATYNKEKDVETELEDDAEARTAMQEVFSNTARWPAEFGGFTADAIANINGIEHKGTVTVKGPKEIETDITDEKAKGFLTENLASIAMHRGPRSFEESDGKYKLRFGDDGTHPLGRKLIMGGDGMSSFYRIKDGRIQQINRQTPRFSFSINIEESRKTQDDKYLTHKYSVFYFNPETKGLKDVESYTDEYTRVGKADLPEKRRIINCEEGAISVCTMTLSNHKIL